MLPIEIVEIWKNDIVHFLDKGNATFIACFEITGEVVYANASMSFLYDYAPQDTILNPSFSYILQNRTEGLFFEGMITIGLFDSTENFSLIGKLFKNKEYILLLGELDVQEIMSYNKIIRELNSENNNLNRLLIKEKNALNEYQIELTESRNKLIELNSSKDNFFSIIAHDLINPLGVFKNLISHMYDEYEDYDDEERKGLLKTILSSSESAYNLLKNLLDWSRAQRGILKPDLSRFNLSNSVTSVLEVLESQFNEKKITINNYVDNSVIVYSDRHFLNTIIRNVISNAIKFTPNNGTITISNELVEKKIILSIKDSGIGMNEELLSKIFGENIKITTKGTNNEVGTGIGIMLIKEFAEKIGSSIKVDSAVNKGTNFQIYLNKPST